MFRKLRKEEAVNRIVTSINKKLNATNEIFNTKMSEYQSFFDDVKQKEIQGLYREGALVGQFNKQKGDMVALRQEYAQAVTEAYNAGVAEINEAIKDCSKTNGFTITEKTNILANLDNLPYEHINYLLSEVSEKDPQFSLYVMDNQLNKLRDMQVDETQVVEHNKKLKTLEARQEVLKNDLGYDLFSKLDTLKADLTLFSNINDLSNSLMVKSVSLDEDGNLKSDKLLTNFDPTNFSVKEDTIL